MTIGDKGAEPGPPPGLPNRLVTARLEIRPLVAGDAAEIQRLANDWAVARWLPRLPHPYALADAHDWIGFAARQRAAGTEWPYAIQRHGDLTPCGSVGMINQPKSQTVELGYWIGKDFWGQGFATEAARALVEAAFDRLPVRAIEAMVMVENAPSIALLTRLGFQVTGDEEHNFPGRGGIRKMHRMRLNRKR